VGAMALFADGVTTLTGLRTLRVKETDRIDAMARELTKMGSSVETTAESMTITPPAVPKTAAIDTYDDHRMAMSFAVAGLRVPGLVINDPGCVAKTFPDFWRRWDAAFGNVAG
jgi:3-phosphoshikimate 1-carboxyvinyltransferase